MPASRQLFTRMAIADVVLFLIAVAFNNQSKTSVDGIIWWVAIAVFVAMIVAGSVVFLQYLRGRMKRPRRTGVR